MVLSLSQVAAIRCEDGVNPKNDGTLGLFLALCAAWLASTILVAGKPDSVCVSGHVGQRVRWS